MYYGKLNQRFSAQLPHLFCLLVISLPDAGNSHDIELPCVAICSLYLANNGDNFRVKLGKEDSNTHSRRADSVRVRITACGLSSAKRKVTCSIPMDFC